MLALLTLPVPSDVRSTYPCHVVITYYHGTMTLSIGLSITLIQAVHASSIAIYVCILL